MHVLEDVLHVLIRVVSNVVLVHLNVLRIVDLHVKSHVQIDVNIHVNTIVFTHVMKYVVDVRTYAIHV